MLKECSSGTLTSKKSLINQGFSGNRSENRRFLFMPAAHCSLPQRRNRPHEPSLHSNVGGLRGIGAFHHSRKGQKWHGKHPRKGQAHRQEAHDEGRHTRDLLQALSRLHVWTDERIRVCSNLRVKPSHDLQIYFSS